jgi:hypothetical protein
VERIPAVGSMDVKKGEMQISLVASNINLSSEKKLLFGNKF